MLNNTRTLRTPKLRTSKKGKKLKFSFFFNYINGHFSTENNTCGATYSIIEYMNLKEYNDDDDGGTVIDRKLIILNNIN